MPLLWPITPVSECHFLCKLWKNNTARRELDEGHYENTHGIYIQTCAVCGVESKDLAAHVRYSHAEPKRGFFAGSKRSYVLLFVFLFLVLAPFASCYGVTKGILLAVGHEEWVYEEECRGFAGDQKRSCTRATVQTREETTDGELHIWAGLITFFIVGRLAVIAYGRLDAFDAEE